MDIEIKNSGIKKSKSIEGIKLLLEEKEQEVLEEIEYKKLLLKTSNCKRRLRKNKRNS